MRSHAYIRWRGLHPSLPSTNNPQGKTLLTQSQCLICGSQRTSNFTPDVPLKNQSGAESLTLAEGHDFRDSARCTMSHLNYVGEERCGKPLLSVCGIESHCALQKETELCLGLAAAAIGSSKGLEVG
jgi:hypothetical protein